LTRVSFATKEIATQFLRYIKNRLSGYLQRNMHGPGSVRPNICFYHQSPAYLAARQAAKAAHGAAMQADFEATFAALEIADRVSDANKAATKSLHQARTHAKRVLTLAFKHPSDETLVAAAANATLVLTNATMAATQVATAAAANDAEAATAAAFLAVGAATAAKEITAALRRLTSQSKPAPADPSSHAASSSNPSDDPDAMEVVDTAPASLITPSSDPSHHQGAFGGATIAPAPTPQDAVVAMDVAPTLAKRPAPPSPPHPPTNTGEKGEYCEDQLELAAIAARPTKKQAARPSLPAPPLPASPRQPLPSILPTHLRDDQHHHRTSPAGSPKYP